MTRVSAPGPHVCFVTCLAWPDCSESDGYVKRALELRDVAVTALPWNEPERRFDGFDAVVFRSSWLISQHNTCGPSGPANPPAR